MKDECLNIRYSALFTVRFSGSRSHLFISNSFAIQSLYRDVQPISGANALQHPAFGIVSAMIGICEFIRMLYSDDAEHLNASAAGYTVPQVSSYQYTGWQGCQKKHREQSFRPLFNGNLQHLNQYWSIQVMLIKYASICLFIIHIKLYIFTHQYLEISNYKQKKALNII